MLYPHQRWGAFLPAIIALTVVAALPRGAAAEDATAAALEHYQRGTKLFDLRRYREAAKEYEAAYDLKERSELLFDIGQAYRYAGMYEDSIASYRAFLRREPRSPDRVDVENRIREMQALLAQARKTHESPPDGTQPARGAQARQASTPARANVAPPPAPPPATVTRSAAGKPAIALAPAAAPRPAAPNGSARAMKIAGVAGAGLGVAALAVGAGFAAMAKNTANQVSTAPVFDPNADHRGKVDQSVAIGLLAGGAALVATGAIVAALGFRAGRSTRFAVVPAIQSNQAGALAIVRF